MPSIKFSIVMPAYGVELYIGDALRCLAGQTYDNFEVIIVDDASPDRTGKIAQSFADKDDRFFVFKHEKNRGVAAARNTGLEHATGEYVLFLDPDDTYDIHLLEVLSIPLSRNPVDVAIYCHTEDYRDRETGKIQYSKKVELDKEVYGDGLISSTDAMFIHKLAMAMEHNTMLGYPWNKAFKRSILVEHDIKFQAITHIEDVLFNCDFFDHVKSLIVLSDVLYHYRNQGQARLTGGSIDYYFELQKKRIQRLLDQHAFWGTLDDEALEILASEYFRSFQSMMIRYKDMNWPEDTIVKKCEKESKTDMFVLMSKHLPEENTKIMLLYQPLAEGKFTSGLHRAKLISFIRNTLPGIYNRAKQIR